MREITGFTRRERRTSVPPWGILAGDAGRISETQRAGLRRGQKTLLYYNGGPDPGLRPCLPGPRCTACVAWCGVRKTTDKRTQYNKEKYLYLFIENLLTIRDITPIIGNVEIKL